MLRRTLIAILLAAAPLPAQTVAAAPPADSVGYQPLLHPGDVIRLRIWREPDLSGEFPVDQSGIVVFPKLGPLSVSSESPGSLKSRLVAAYQVYLRNPSIDVTLLRRVNVLGAVRNPGLYPVDATMVLADVIAAAGGASVAGKLDEVQLIRDGRTITTNVTSGTRIADLRIRSGDQLFVPERSWASRNSAVVAAAITATVSLLIALRR